MTNKDRVLKIARENNGVLLTKEVTEAGIPRETLIRLVQEELLFPVQRGIYVTDEGYVDDFFLLQVRFPQGIFSHETSLYLQGLSDRVPIIPTMTFKFGTSTGRMKNSVRPVIVSRDLDLGRTQIIRNGRRLIVYDVERTLVDLLKPRYRGDIEQFIPAIKQYAQSKERDITKLMSYAQHFSLEQELQKYIGGLL